MLLPSLYINVTQPMLVVLYRSCGAVCRLQRTWSWKLDSKMERNLCFILDSRHVMKVIYPFQLAVAVNICFMKSWLCNTCECQAIQIFAYVHKHQQTDLHQNYSCVVSSSRPSSNFRLIPSSTQPCILPSFLYFFYYLFVS